MKAAEQGILTSNTLNHFVLPICLQAVLQRGASQAAFDPNYAETAVKCLGECMHHVAWGTCLQSVRFLAGLLTKKEMRERWIVRAACECLTRYKFPETALPSPSILVGVTAEE